MLIGKRISGRYKLLDMIGGGGMSNVYLAHDMILDRDVAMKVLRYDFSNQEELHRRFQREALSATSLTHPNIVNIYDVGEDGDIHYIVMEYVKGETLKEYIQNNSPISPNRCITIMKQLTSAIADAHNNNIVHRDVKPQNILLDEEGKVKITDFGIAMALSATSYTQTNSVLGTVHYLSPEQARGGTATKQSDIYALGIVLFELLTGELPFSGESAVSIALKHLQSETPSIRAILPSIPQSLENVVIKATSKDPRDRYGTAEEMEADLATAMTPERANEEKFVVELDEGATKVLPVIKEPISFDEVSETKKISVKPSVVEDSKDKKKKKKWKVISGVLASILLIAMIVIIAFPGIFKAEKIEVPNVSNLELAEAIKKLEAEGFIVGEQTKEYSEEIAEDFVIRTTPEAGKIRDKETEISIYISSGKETSVIADYRGRDIDLVKTLLQNQGLKEIKTVEKFSDQPVGIILEQTPEDGTELVPSETELIFTVSKGLELQRVKDLTGFNEKALSDYENSSGFTIEIVETRNSDNIPSGNVMTQTPTGNTKVEPGSTIEVVISGGPKAKASKLFVKSITIPYEEAPEALAPQTEEVVEDVEEEVVEGNVVDELEIEADPIVPEPVLPEPEPEPEKLPPAEVVKQVVRIYIQDKTRTMAEPVEEFVLTKTVERQIKLEISEGQKAAYRIEVNKRVIAEETITYEDIK
ncbi:serine/threonine-protein kinase [Psychrobacillus insolitus]|uniref:Serine/threonine-protein kinase PrkC n=1 Tax=Psychrobacillus insolitus TaxID=1461 RepID=A0A2W7MKW0_9BACI|nr:Stk1 family PASTA domain-containing Ser/Thr kinase [Psychrobacillus insolitus]PZX07982.1 serine/threonine-protein kinase [Psychrobacillus insolitus]